MTVFADLVWIVIVPVATALLLILLLLIRETSRPRRRGTTPHCAKCDYNLTGLTSDRCPECGQAVTPESIVYGERRRRPFVIVAYGVTILWLLFVCFNVGRKVDWYQCRPAGWVLQDLQSSNPATFQKAWRELERRTKAGRLSARHRARLIDLCLKEQGADLAGRPIRGDMIQYLGRCYLDGSMSEGQEKTFFDQIIQFQFDVRPKVVAGDPVPYLLDEKCRCPSSALWIRLAGGEVWIDGKRNDKRLDVFGAMSGAGAGGSNGGTLECDGIGRHTVKVIVNIEVYRGKFNDPESSRLVHQSEYVQGDTFEILETEPPDYIKLIDDPLLKESLLNAIQPHSFEYRKRPNDYLHMKFRVVELPLNVAFDIIARMGQDELRLGTLRLRKGASGDHGSGSSIIPPRDTFDLILRSNKKLARQSVDMFEIWQGELVYQGVQIEPEER